MDKTVHSLAQILSKPDDQMRLLLLILAAYPFGYLFRLIHGKWMRHAYSIIAGMMIHYFMFRGQAIHFWALGIVVYLLMSFIDRKVQAPIVFAVCLTHLSVMHIMRVIYDYGGWSLDCTTFLMPLVSRLSSLGYCYSDGQPERQKSLIEEQESRKLDKKPTLLEIFSYISYPAANLCGPFFEFRDYIDFIEENGRYANIPSSLKQTLRSTAYGIFNLVAWIILMENFDPANLGKEEMANRSFISKWFFMIVCWFTHRTKFYVVWNFNDGSIHLSGLSYNGKDEQGNAKFDKIQCCDMLGVELCTVPREGIRCWNTMTTEWLRHYVFTLKFLIKTHKLSIFFSQNLRVSLTEDISFWIDFESTIWLVS